MNRIYVQFNIGDYGVMDIDIEHGNRTMKTILEKFVVYKPTWYHDRSNGVRCIRIVHTSNSRHKTVGYMLLYLDDNNNVHAIKLDGHVLESKIRRALGMFDDTQTWPLKIPTKHIWTFVEFLIEHSDNTHIFGEVWCDENTYRCFLKGEGVL